VSPRSADAAGSGAVIEHAGPDDWERVRAVRLRALQDAPDAFLTTVEQARAKSAEAWREQLASTAAATFLALIDGRDVGMAVGAPHHHDPGEAGLYGVWVATEARGRGVGVDLLAAVTTWARERGYARIRLDVGDHNREASRLYSGFGFSPTGETSSFPPPRQHVTEHELALDL
jgi:ribosomal protein S18 acetylase RimI-like enzyme